MKSKNRNYKIVSKKKSFVVDKPIHSKKLRLIPIFFYSIFALLILRIFWLQFIRGRMAKRKSI